MQISTNPLMNHPILEYSEILTLLTDAQSESLSNQTSRDI